VVSASDSERDLLEDVHRKLYCMALPEVMVTDRTRDCEAETWSADALILRVGGDPATGVIVTFAGKDVDPDVTVTLQSTGTVKPEGMLRVLSEVTERLRSMPWQLQANTKVGCLSAAKLGSYDCAALMRPPDEPILMESPPDITAIGRSGVTTNTDEELTTPLRARVTVWTFSRDNVYRGTMSLFSKLAKTSCPAALRMRQTYASAILAEHADTSITAEISVTELRRMTAGT